MQCRSLNGAISISKEIQLAGFSSYFRYGDIENSDLEISIIQLRQNTQANIVTLCTIDALSVGQNLVNYMEKLVAGPCIFLASHTHSAPNLDEKLACLGSVDPEYFKNVCETLHEMITKLSVQAFEDVIITLSTGITNNVKRRRIDFSIFNRGFTVRCSHKKQEKYPIFVGNIKSVIDQSCLARLWSIPCHPVSTPNYSTNGADFIGIIRKYFRQSDNCLSTNLFIQGLSGDLRPPSFTKSFNLRTIVNEFISRFGFKLFTSFNEEEYQLWVQKIFRDLKFCLENENLNISDHMAYHETALPLSSIVLEKSNDLLHIKGLRLGDVCFIFLQGEPVSGWYTELPKSIAGLRMIYLGYSGPVFGYLPTSYLIPYGGYEVRGFGPFFGFKNSFNNKITSEVQRKISDLVYKLAENNQNFG